MATPSIDAPFAHESKVGVVRKYVLWGAVLTIWLVLLGVGMRRRFAYETTPGAVGSVPSSFPEGSRIARRAGQRTLLMFVHPECPCTKASLTELGTLLERPTPDLQRVLVVAPLLDASRTFADSPAYALAQRIGELERFDDRDEREATRFGAMTSGFVVLYDADGKLQFSGGITGSRGHVGENVAMSSLRRLLASESIHDAQHPVYGCPLESRE